MWLPLSIYSPEISTFRRHKHLTGVSGLDSVSSTYSSIWIGRCWALLLFWSNRGDKLIKAASEPWNEMLAKQLYQSSTWNTRAIFNFSFFFFNLSSPLLSQDISSYFSSRRILGKMWHQRKLETNYQSENKISFIVYPHWFNLIKYQLWGFHLHFYSCA